MSAILFSPLGKTDLREIDDGPTLHILKHYPEISKVVFYLSKEMIEVNSKELFDGFVSSVRSGVLSEFIERRDLIDVHHFDVLYDDFGDVLAHVAAENQGATIYVNVSSGTPAFKATLMVLAELGSVSIQPLQVDDPRYNFNENRIHEVQTKNFRRLITIQNIKTLIDEYDYNAAKALAKDTVSDESKTLIDGAAERYELRCGQARKRLGESIAVTLLGSPSPIGKAFEYLQYLQLLSRKEEWAAFLRATDPALISVLLCAIGAFTDYEQQQLVKSEGTMALNVELIQKDTTLSKYFERDLAAKTSSDRFISWYPLRALLEECSTGLDDNLKKSLKDLDALQTRRNRFVHSIQALEYQAHNHTQKWLELLVPLLKAAAENKGENLPPWESYDYLNDKIKASLDLWC